MSGTTDKMSQAGGGRVPTDQGVGSPKKGERFRCAKCGMAIEVAAACGCDQPGLVHFHCCGKELQKA